MSELTQAQHDIIADKISEIIKVNFPGAFRGEPEATSMAIEHLNTGIATMLAGISMRVGWVTFEKIRAATHQRLDELTDEIVADMVTIRDETQGLTEQ